MNKRTLGFYAGSFDPFHKGHLDIVIQASKIFDNVLVAKGVNSTKMKLVPARYPLPENFLAKLGVFTTSYNTLLIEQVKAMEENYNITIIRGLRSGADLEYEQNLAAFLRGMYPQIKIVAFYCDPKYRHISSSALRDIEKFSPLEFQKYIVID